MNAFHELFRHQSLPPQGQIFADERSVLFPEVVAHSSRLTLWERHEAPPTSGQFLLVGIATWSGYDMMLLDAIERSTGNPDAIGVFDTAHCKSNEDFEAWIPSIGIVYQSPVVGLWDNGKLVARGSGHEGREIAFRACGLDPECIRELLDPRTALTV